MLIHSSKARNDVFQDFDFVSKFTQSTGRFQTVHFDQQRNESTFSGRRGGGGARVDVLRQPLTASKILNCFHLNSVSDRRRRRRRLRRDRAEKNGFRRHEIVSRFCKKRMPSLATADFATLKKITTRAHCTFCFFFFFFNFILVVVLPTCSRLVFVFVAGGCIFFPCLLIAEIVSKHLFGAGTETNVSIGRERRR